MSFFRGVFNLKNAHRVACCLKPKSIKSCVFHPITLVSLAAVGIPFATIYCSDDKAASHNAKLPEPFKLPDDKDLSLKKLIQHSSYLTVNAVLQLVQLTTAAVIDASKKYRESVAAEMIVLNQSIEFANLENMQGELNDLLIIIRADTQQAKANLQEFLGFMEYVEKLADAAAETSFLSGAEYPSFSLSDAIHDAKRRISRQQDKNKIAAEELSELQKEVILKSVKPEKSDEKPDQTEDESTDQVEAGEIADPIDKPTHIMFNNF